MPAVFRLVSAVLALVACLSAAGEDRPNLILLLTDDQRADTLGCYGVEWARTPHIDRLAAEGVVFDRAFVTSAICMTSRATILTGQYAARHGIWDFRTGLDEEAFQESYLGRLRAAGYHTGFIGKWGVGPVPEPGWLDFDRSYPGQGNYRVEGPDGPRHLTEVLGGQMLEFLDQAPAGRPFHLSVSFKAPHVQDEERAPNSQPFPYDPALAGLYAGLEIPLPPTATDAHFQRLPPFLQNSEARSRWATRFWGPGRHQESLRSYHRLIAGVDVQVGRLMKRLEELGLAERTLVIFTSDHGFYLGDHGLAGKWFPHDVSIRIPLILRDPRLAEERRGARVGEMALTVDLAPTLLEAAGLEPSAGMQGRGLRPLAEGEVPDDWRRDFFYEHLFRYGGPPFARLPMSEALRGERWKYMRFLLEEEVHEMLFDLEADPWEEHDLAGDPAHGERLDELRERWRVLRERAHADWERD